MKKSDQYSEGELETRKFDSRKVSYYDGLEIIKSMDYKIDDFIHHFPSFVGHMTISRFLVLYELYRMSLGVSGHVAEVGIYKGASLLWLAKLTQIFEPESLTQVHGFDWFQGMAPGDQDSSSVKNHAYMESYERLTRLIKAQSLGDTVRVHKLDVTRELRGFFKKWRHLQFKLVFLDAGTYDVVKACIPLFWERLTKGGILIFDQFNHELSPGETQAIRELLPEQKVQSFSWGWMPSGYVVK